MFYSKSTGGFYDKAIHGDRIPADAVEIADEQYALLLIGQSQGKRIEADVNGRPVLITPPAPTLADLKAIKNAEINAACRSAIYLGFKSSALGAAHAYPAKNLDQQNLSASVLASLMPGLPSTWTTPFWCADAAGVWDFRGHTAAQIQLAGQDGKAAILTALGKNKTLADQVAAATTAAQVAAIVW